MRDERFMRLFSGNMNRILELSILTVISMQSAFVHGDRNDGSDHFNPFYV